MLGVPRLGDLDHRVEHRRHDRAAGRVHHLDQKHGASVWLRGSNCTSNRSVRPLDAGLDALEGDRVGGPQVAAHSRQRSPTPRPARDRPSRRAAAGPAPPAGGRRTGRAASRPARSQRPAPDPKAAMRSCPAQADGGGPETSTRPRFPGIRLHTMLPKRRVQPEAPGYRHAFGPMSEYEQTASIPGCRSPLGGSRRSVGEWYGRDAFESKIGCERFRDELDELSGPRDAAARHQGRPVRDLGRARPRRLRHHLSRARRGPAEGLRAEGVLPRGPGHARRHQHPLHRQAPQRERLPLGPQEVLRRGAPAGAVQPHQHRQRPARVRGQQHGLHAAGLRPRQHAGEMAAGARQPAHAGGAGSHRHAAAERARAGARQPRLASRHLARQRDDPRHRRRTHPARLRRLPLRDQAALPARVGAGLQERLLGSRAVHLQRRPLRALDRHLRVRGDALSRHLRHAADRGDLAPAHRRAAAGRAGRQGPLSRQVPQGHRLGA